MVPKITNVLNAATAAIQGGVSGIKSREDAQALKKAQNVKLQIAQNQLNSQGNPELTAEALNEQNKVLIKQSKQMSAQLNENKLNRLFENLSNSGDVAAFSRGMSDPDLSKASPNLAGITSINLDDSNDIRMLQNSMDAAGAQNVYTQGLEEASALKKINDPNPNTAINEGTVDTTSPTPDSKFVVTKEFIQANPQYARRFVKVMGKDGKQAILDLSPMKANSGYWSYVNSKVRDKEIKDLDFLLKVKKLAVEGSQKPKAGTLSKEVRLAKDRVIADQNAAVAEDPNKVFTEADTAIAVRDELNKIEEVNSGTSSTRNLNAGEKALKDITDKFGIGAENYTDTPENKNFRDRLLNKAEKGLDQKWTPREVEKAGQLKKLVKLGKTIGDNLSDEDVGWFDNNVLKVKDLFTSGKDSDKASVVARAAWNTFRLEFTRLMSGTAVSKSEQPKIDNAFATLNQNFPKVMASVLVQMRTIKSELENFGINKLAVSMKMRLGLSIKEADNVVSNIDGLLNKYLNLAEGTPIEELEAAGTNPADPVVQKDVVIDDLLDGIFNKRAEPAKIKGGQRQ